MEKISTQVLEVIMQTFLILGKRKAKSLHTYAILNKSLYSRCSILMSL